MAQPMMSLQSFRDMARHQAAIVTDSDILLASRERGLPWNVDALKNTFLVGGQAINDFRAALPTEPNGQGTLIELDPDSESDNEENGPCLDDFISQDLAHDESVIEGIQDTIQALNPTFSTLPSLLEDNLENDDLNLIDLDDTTPFCDAPFRSLQDILTELDGLEFGGGDMPTVTSTSNLVITENDIFQSSEIANESKIFWIGKTPTRALATKNYKPRVAPKPKAGDFIGKPRTKSTKEIISKRLFEDQPLKATSKPGPSRLQKADLESEVRRQLPQRGKAIAKSQIKDDDSGEEFPELLDLLSPRKPKTRDSRFSQPPPSDNRLIRTPLLEQFGLAYQFKYDCVICEECGAGIGFNQCVSHATNGNIVSYYFDQKAEEWRKEGGRSGSGRRHSCPHPRKKSGKGEYTEAELMDMIYKELFETIGHEPNRITLSAATSLADVDRWLALTALHSDQIGPIKGLKVYHNIWQCTTATCDHSKHPFHANTLDTVKKHIKKQHPGISEMTWRRVTAQTFTHRWGYKKWFMVSGNEAETPSTVAKLSKEEVIKRERERLLEGVLQDVGSNRQLIDPPYVDMGIADFWSSLDMETVKPLLALAPIGNSITSTENRLLQRAVIATFVDIAGHVPSSHPSLRFLINKGAYIKNPRRMQSFKIPEARTLGIYVVVEIQLLRWMIYAFNNVIATNSGDPLFSFDEEQTTAMIDLIQSLQENKSISDVAKHVIRTLHSLYFPSDPDRSVYQPFAEPVVTFVGLQCLTESGTAHQITNIPPFCSRMQFSMRLRGYHYLYTTALRAGIAPKPGSVRKKTFKPNTASEEVPHPITRSKQNPNALLYTVDDSDDDYSPSDESEIEKHTSLRNKARSTTILKSDPAIKTMEIGQIPKRTKKATWWGETAVPFCDEFLAEERVSPYSFVRDMMHVFSAAVGNQRKIANVSWRDDNTMILEQHVIQIDEFRDYLHSQLQFLEKFCQEKLLFGCDTSSMVNFELLVDSVDTTSNGYNPLLERLEGNADSDAFLNFLLENQTSLITIKNNGMVWGIQMAEQWSADIHFATLTLFALIHITQGSPSRITEEFFMQIANTLFGRRHLFVLNGYNTLATWSNYWKGSKVSGKFKEILRVIPQRVAKLLVILIRIIRPVEVMYLLRHRVPLSQSDKNEVTTAYTSSLWASLGAPLSVEALRNSIPAFFRTPASNGKLVFDFNFNVRLYRHFAAAVQRRHLSDLSPRYTKTHIATNVQTGDLQAGHTSQTSSQNYAVEAQVVGIDPNFRDHYIKYSLAWHEFWHLNDSSQDL